VSDGSIALWIPGRFPALNDLIRAKGSIHRGGRSAYTDMKKRHTQRVCEAAWAAKLPKVPRAFFAFEWFERNRQRNPDNVAAGGRKFIFDGLVLARVIPNDGWIEVAGWSDNFYVVGAGESDGVWVTIRTETAWPGPLLARAR
jgi:hypothetical protein